MNKSKLYLILSLLFIGGIVWLFFIPHVEVCLFKRVTGIPCPSCGSTRSVEAILHGHFLEALKLNPLGYILFCALIILPFWLIFDITAKTDSLLSFYNGIEKLFTNKTIVISAILLMVANWIWNIIKYV